MSWFRRAHYSRNDKTGCLMALLQIPSRSQRSPGVPSRARGTEVTPQETQRAIWRDGQCGGASEGAGCASVTGVCAQGGWVTAPLRLGTLPRQRPPWVSPLGATGSTASCGELFPQLGTPRAAPSRAGCVQPKSEAGREPCGCHKRGETRLGSIHQCAARLNSAVLTSPRFTHRSRQIPLCRRARASPGDGARGPGDAPSSSRARTAGCRAPLRGAACEFGRG